MKTILNIPELLSGVLIGAIIILLERQDIEKWSDMWNLTTATIFIIILIYWLYYRLKLRLKKLYELHDRSTDFTTSIMKTNHKKNASNMLEIQQAFVKLGHRSKLVEDGSLEEIQSPHREKLIELESEVKELFKNF